MLFVAAAGNEALDNDLTPAYPASYNIDNILSVLATDHANQRSSFSNWGKTTVHLGAPGENILSTMPNNSYEYMSGTSMASPHVAGAAALLLSVNPELTYLDIKQILMSTADRLVSLIDLSVSEARLNLNNAIQAVGGADVLPPTPNPAQWDIVPTATGLHHIVMRSVVAEDPSGVEYYFECLEDESLTSGWQDSPLYQVFTAAEGTTYTFRVQYRDKSENQNVGFWSEEVSTTTASGVDDLPPAPNPARWAAVPRKIGTNTTPSIFMEAQTHYDENGVEYRFVCVFTDDPRFSDPNDPFYAGDANELSSDWQTATYYTTDNISPIGPPNSPRYKYDFELQVRDQSALQNPTTAVEVKSVVIGPPPRTLTVPFPYATIQSALNAAYHGDTVVVRPAIYTGGGNINLDFQGKAVTLRSENPDDPSVVAATIIDPQGSQTGGGGRAFLFGTDPNFVEGRDTVVTGFTIQNAYAVGGPKNPPSPQSDPNGLDAFGGAVYAINGSSPTLINLIIRDSFAQGQDGRNGNAGQGGQRGADGGDGGDGIEGEYHTPIYYIHPENGITAIRGINDLIIIQARP